MSGVAIQERMSGGWCAYEFQPVCDCKARMSSVAFCAEEVIVDVLKLSVVFSRRYFSC